MLEDNKKTFNASKLVATVKAMVTKINKAKINKEPKMKTTTISFANSGIKLSNEHFSEGFPEGELAMIPLPYACDKKVADKDCKYTEVVCIWRAYIVDSEEDIEPENAATKDTNCDLMLKTMQGEQI